MLLNAAILSESQIFLFTMHITRNKILAGIAGIAVLVVAGIVFWWMRRRKPTAGSAP